MMGPLANSQLKGGKYGFSCEPMAATFYVFSSPATPVWGRPEYRNNVPKPRGIHDYYNIMWDPHVRRGDPMKTLKQKAAVEQCLKLKKIKRKLKDVRPVTPPPIAGRQNCQIQTEECWESLDVELPTNDVKTQTIALHELPVTQWFMQSKIGEDKETQILPGELFNFDCEVKPLIESLIGKVVEQALLECMEEEELMSLKDQQMIFEERRRQEQLRLERLREREQRQFDEKERLMKEMQLERAYEEDAENRIGAKSFTSLYLSGMKDVVVKKLDTDGYINSMKIVSSVFLPWLNCQIEQKLKNESVARAILDDAIRYGTIKREAQYEGPGRHWEVPPSTPIGEIVGEHGDGE